MPQDEPPATSKVPPEVFSDAAFCEKYRIERELGVGGAGVVVRAVHLELDRRVAIKFLLPGVAQGETLVRFRREAWAASRIRDEHVVRIIDVSKTSTGVPYVVMEYLDGTDMERMLLETPNRQLQVRDAIEFVLQACEALAECHQIGIVHRDLKPSNLFWVEQPDGLPLIKVLDFGISKFERFAADGSMTGQNAILGSPRYMSPEQFDSPANVDQRTDLWSIGVILYEFVTGRTPFEDEKLLEIWRKVKTVQPKPLHELRRDAPAQLEPVILKCLAKDPSQRYPNVAEFAKALAHLASERARGSIARIVRIVEAPGATTESLALPASGPASGGPATFSVLPKDPPKPRSRGRLLVVSSAVVGFGLAALGLSRSFQRQPEPRTIPEAPPPERTLAAPPVEAQLLEPAQTKGDPSPTTVDNPSPDVAAATASKPDAPSNRPTPPATRNEPRERGALRAEKAKQPDAEDAQAEPAASAAAPIVAPPASADEVSTAPTSEPAPASSVPSSPWIVDIVDQRKRKPAAKAP